MVNIPSKTMKILLKVQSPTVDELVAKYMPYGYDSYRQSSHNTGIENVEGLEEFCKLVYTDWYYKMTRGSTNAPKNYQEVTAKLLSNPSFHPDNLAKQGNLPFYNFFKSGYDENFKGTGTRPALLQNGNGLLKDEEFGGNDFFHIFGYGINGLPRDSVDARLYLNLKGENIPLVAIEAYKKCRERNLPFYFKFELQDSRNDPFLFYTSYKNLPQYVDIIETIKQEHPAFFDGTEKVSKNMGVLNGYIGYGDEPVVSRGVWGGNYSYNSLRSECVDNFRKALIHDVEKKFNKQGNNEVFATKPNNLTFDECCDLVFSKYLPQILTTNASKEDMAKIEETAKRQFKTEIRRSILSGKPIEDIQLSWLGSSGTSIKTSSIDWLKALYQYADLDGKQFTRTAFRGYLTRFTVFSGKKLNKDELNLIQMVREKLIEGLHEDLNDSKMTEKNKQDIQKYLDKIEGDFDELDDTAKGLLLLSSANFVMNNKLLIKSDSNTLGGFIYHKQALDIYKQILGDEKIELYTYIYFDNANVSRDNVCFNAETDAQVQEARQQQALS